MLVKSGQIGKDGDNVIGGIGSLRGGAQIKRDVQLIGAIVIAENAFAGCEVVQGLKPRYLK